MAAVTDTCVRYIPSDSSAGKPPTFVVNASIDFLATQFMDPVNTVPGFEGYEADSAGALHAIIDPDVFSDSHRQNHLEALAHRVHILALNDKRMKSCSSATAYLDALQDGFGAANLIVKSERKDPHLESNVVASLPPEDVDTFVRYAREMSSGPLIQKLAGDERFWINISLIMDMFPEEGYGSLGGILSKCFLKSPTEAASLVKEMSKTVKAFSKSVSTSFEGTADSEVELKKHLTKMRHERLKKKIVVCLPFAFMSQSEAIREIEKVVLDLLRKGAIPEAEEVDEEGEPYGAAILRILGPDESPPVDMHRPKPRRPADFAASSSSSTSQGEALDVRMFTGVDYSHSEGGAASASSLTSLLAEEGAPLGRTLSETGAQARSIAPRRGFVLIGKAAAAKRSGTP